MGTIEQAPASAGARSVPDFCDRLRELRAWAGTPSYNEISCRVARLRAARGVPAGEQRPGRVTVYDCFRDGRRRLDIELVVDIVRVLGVDEETARTWRRVYGELTGGPVPGPVAVPPVEPAFVGRAAELAHLGAAAVTVIEGMPGVGKTALAVAAAHRFTGRRVLVDLRRPVDLAAVRADVLVLDAAAGVAQVRSLVRATGGARVLVTSRRSLLGLPGATRLHLDVLPPADSAGVLAALVGDRVAHEPGSAAELAEMAGHLPAALHYVAGQVLAKPDWTLSDHVRRLYALPPDESVREALSASLRHLPPPARFLFRRLGLHPGPVITVPAAAALAGVDAHRAAALLDALHAEHLLALTEPGRYRMHRLVRSFTGRQVRLDDPHSEQLAALARLRALSTTQPAGQVTVRLGSG